MKQYYIYKTTNLINNKIYIGQHYGKLDDSYIGSGTNLKKAINKYGKENFVKEILEICETREELNEAEIKWISYFQTHSSVEIYNLAPGGLGSGDTWGNMSEEERKKRSQKQSEMVSGKNNYFYGKHLSKEQHPWFGKHHSEESKEKMRQKKIGGLAPTAHKISIFDLDGNFLQSFDTISEFQEFLGLSPQGSSSTILKRIKDQKPYHNYIIKSSK